MKDSDRKLVQILDEMIQILKQQQQEINTIKNENNPKQNNIINYIKQRKMTIETALNEARNKHPDYDKQHIRFAPWVSRIHELQQILDIYDKQ